MYPNSGDQRKKLEEKIESDCDSDDTLCLADDTGNENKSWQNWSRCKYEGNGYFYHSQHATAVLDKGPSSVNGLTKDFCQPKSCKKWHQDWLKCLHFKEFPKRSDYGWKNSFTPFYVPSETYCYNCGANLPLGGESKYYRLLTLLYVMYTALFLEFLCPNGFRCDSSRSDTFSFERNNEKSPRLTEESRLLHIESNTFDFSNENHCLGCDVCHEYDASE